MPQSNVLLRIAVFLCLVLPFTAISQTSPGSLGGIPFSYSLSTNAKTSAGVFKPDSTLVRTLWGNEQKNAGTYTASWDGKDDAGNMMPDGNYQVRVLSNNVTYEWEGVVGNSSKYKAGRNVYNQPFEGISDMRIVNKRAVFATGYNERRPAEYFFNTDSPQVKQDIWLNFPFANSTQSTMVCTDKITYYFGGTAYNNGNGNIETLCYARKVSDLTKVNFSSGVSTQTDPQIENFSAIAIDAFPAIHNITGMAVQQTGNYLFIAKLLLNKLLVLNKTTGALVQTLSYDKPGYLDIDGSDNSIWMLTSNNTCKKYPINSNGTLGIPTITLAGLVSPLCVQITPDGSKVYIADGGTSQQVKIYNSSTGALLNTFGQQGGYANGPVITHDKFMFSSGKAFDQATNPYNYDKTFICFDNTDNSWWMEDAGNQRVMHFSSSNSLIEQIDLVGYHYSVSVDANNTTRVFANYVEFAIDYSKPLSPSNGSWKKVKNWAYGVQQSQDNQFKRLFCPTTLSNGKTYALNGYGNNSYYVVELGATGLRFTGQSIEPQSRLQGDGSLLSHYGGNTVSWKKQPLIGFDSNGNPIWSSETTIASTVPDTLLPDDYGQYLGGKYITTSGLIAYFNGEKSNKFHLGGIKPGTNRYLWKASPSTHINYKGEFPKNGDFDIGNITNYCGGALEVIDKSLIYSYKGENWKGVQCNYYNHFYEDGLMISQYGTNDIEASQRNEGTAPAFLAGNTTALVLVKVGNDYYSYNNDESRHGGIHRWKISGLNTIQERSSNIVKTGTPPAFVPDYVDLMAGLPFDAVVPNNTAGWTRFSSESPNFSVTTSSTTYKKNEQDIRIFSIGQNVDCWVKRALGNNSGLSNWKITGELCYPEAGEYGDNFVEVLDNNERVIVRISRPQTLPNLEIKGNKSRIAYGPEVFYNVGHLQPLSIVANGNSITINYADYSPVTVSLFDSTADPSKPTTLRFYTVSQPSGHQVDAANLKFYKSITPAPIIRHFRTKASGLWNTASTWESSTDSTTWADATTIPDSTAGAITIRSGHTVAISDSANADQLAIQSTGALNIAPNASFIINDGPGSDVTVAASAKMTIQSDATGTGRIGKSSGTVNGNVIVERFITALNNKAYRLLGPSVTTTGGPKPYIRDNWQEGQNNSNVLSNSDAFAGYGIHISGSINGSNGFDATLPGLASMYYYNQAATVQAWQPIPNTNATNFEVGKGYMVYIRGDRSTDLAMNTTSSNTTLRTTGTLATGTQTFAGLESNGRNSLVTNPYASPIDWNTLYNDATTSNAANFENFYTYLDPNIGLSGGYVTVAANGTKSAGTNATTEIQTGQAFFIRAKPGITSPAFVVKENHKSPTTNLNVFRNGGREQFMSGLYFTDANGNKVLADAVNNVFDNAFSTAVDRNDAEELANWDENVAILRTGKMLSIEGRPLIDVTDTVQLNVQNLRTINYEWQFKPMDFTHPTLKAYLEDKYTNVRTQIDLSGAGTTTVAFSVTMDMASGAADRFRIVFAPNSTLPVTLRSIKAYQKGLAIQVEWNVSQELNIDHYEVEKSADGRQFVKAGSVAAHNAGSLSQSYMWLDQYPKEGNNFYRIKTVDKNGTISYSTIVNVKTGDKNENIAVYPNPVTGNYLTVQFNNLVRGSYTITVLNVMGQKIVTRTIDHPGGSASQSIVLNNGLPAGSYNLQVTGNGISVNQKIVKQ